MDIEIRRHIASCIVNDAPEPLLDTLKKLNLKPIEYEHVGGETLLHKAAANNSIQCIKSLLDQGIPIDSPDDSNETPLMVALALGCYQASILLIERGASLKTRERWAPMIRTAIYGGNIELVKLLVEKSVDINEVSEGFSSTPLKFALAQPDKEIAEYLMSIGAKLEVD